MGKFYQALIQERADLVAEAKGIVAKAEAEGRPLSDEEKGRDDAIVARLNVLTADIDREEARREWERSVEAVPSGRQDGGAPRIEGMRDLAAERPFSSFGDQLRAVYGAAMNPGMIDRRLLAITGAGESGTSGEGFLVQQEFTREMLGRMYDQGQIMSRVRQRELGPNANGIKISVLKETSRVTGSRWGGVRMHWINEGGTLSASRPQYRRFALDLEKLGGLYVATDELLQDVVALEGEVSDSFLKEVIFTCEDAVISGDGAGKPLGIKNGPALVTVAKESGQAAATIVYKNLLKMWTRLWAGSRPNAIWLYNQDCEEQLFQLALTVGTAALEPRFITFGPDGQLRAWGRPMLASEYCESVGTVGDIILADFNEYRWIDKGGVQSASSIHVYFSTDEMAFRFIYRCNGAPFWESVLTPAKGSSTLAPAVVLATRS